MHRPPLLSRLRRAVDRAVPAVLLGAALLVGAPPAAASTPAVLAGPGAAAAGSVSAVTAPDDRRVVLVGTGGISWADVTPDATPALWAAVEDGAAGNLMSRSAESSTCPADGWLAVSAGNRAADAFNARSAPCRLLENAVEGAGVDVPAWDEYLAAVAEQSFDARPGTLGDLVVDQGVTAAALGPGAAVALATSDGTVAGTYRPSMPGTTPTPASTALGPQVTDALGDAALVVVDVGSVRDEGYGVEPKPVAEEAEPEDEASAETEEVDEETWQARRAADVATVDATLAAVLEGIRAHDADLSDTTVVIASLADPSTNPRMQVAVTLGAGQETGTLSSRSTRQPGFVQATDVLPTVLAALDLADDAPTGVLVGSPMRADGSSTSAAERIAALTDAEDHALAARPLIPVFFPLYVVVNLLLFAAVSFGFSRRFVDAVARGGTGAAARGTGRLTDRLAPAISTMPVVVLTVLRAVGIAIAAIPVSTLLANLTPWWRAAAPSMALLGLVLGWIVAITALAVLPPWRTWLFGPVGVVASVTAVVLAVDVATGAHLQVSALMGVQPTVAGRFYGFNNTAFALFATTTVLLAAAASNHLVELGRRRAAALVVAVIGLVAVALDGSPSIGADFGGPPALVPAFAILALLAAGVRLTWRRVLVVLVVGAVVVSGFALVDWLRPAGDRTHLGRFVDTVLDGGMLDVVMRKLEANFRTLRNELALVGIAGILVIVLVLGRPLRTASKAPDSTPYQWLTEGAPLKQINNDAPMFTPGVVCTIIALGIGTLVNDSGIVILAVGMSVLVPLITATYGSWMLTLRRTTMRAEAGAALAAGTTTD